MKNQNDTTENCLAMRTRRRWPLAVVAAFCVVVAGCGSDETDATAAERSVVTTDEAGDVATTTAPSTTEPASAETSESIEPDSTVAEDDEVPGEPLDFAPVVGTELAVVGVAFDDTLNFRAQPSPDADVIRTVAPLDADVAVAIVGQAWAAPSGVWWNVEVDGTEAWANQAFLGSLGTSADFFDDVAAELGVLMFDDVEAAALAVAETRVSDDVESLVVLVAEPLAFEVGGSAVVDVLGLADDSVKGERIRIAVEIVFDEDSGEEGAQDVAFVVLTEVEISPICGRGVTEGLCV